MELTLEQLYNNYQFKLIKRTLMREYPWVVDVRATEEDLIKYKSIVFVNIVFDGPRFEKDTGLKLASWAYEPWASNNVLYLSTFIKNDQEREAKDLQREMQNLVTTIAHSTVIPNELRLPKTSTGYPTSVELNEWTIVNNLTT
jgi:hypothetical protein